MDDQGEEEKFVNLWPVEAHIEREYSEDKNFSPGDGVLQLEENAPPLLVEDLSVECSKGDVDIPVQSYIRYEVYQSELQMPDIVRLMKTALSEPYSIYTYRYFIHNWPQLCILARCGASCVGAIVCKLEIHHYNTRRGYIAMLAVHEHYRKRKIGRM